MEEKMLKEVQNRVDEFRKNGIEIEISLPIDNASKVFVLEVEKQYAYKNLDIFQFLFNELGIKYDYAFEISFNKKEQSYVMFAYKY